MNDFLDLSPEAQAVRLERAGRDALGHWGIHDASLKLIKHRENAVFEVAANGDRAALRLHRHGYHSDDELRSELAWMQALAEAGIRVPEPIPTGRGEAFVTLDDAGLPGKLQVDLFEWIDGRQLGSVEDGIDGEDEVQRIFAALGELAGRVHNQSAAWQPPRDFVRHAWDADGLAGEQPFWGRFWEIAAASSAERELLARVRARIHADLSALPRTPDVYSMIHADFCAENIMLADGEMRLIDFDDAGFGWHLFELATALYFVRGEAWFDQAEAALIAGYRKSRELPDATLEWLPLMTVARSTTYLGWVHTRSETETARELTPMLLEMACGLAEDYLST